MGECVDVQVQVHQYIWCVSGRCMTRLTQLRHLWAHRCCLFLRKKIGLPIAILFLPCMPFFKLRTNLVFILLQDDQDFERFCKENAALLDSICGGDEVPIKMVG